MIAKLDFQKGKRQGPPLSNASGLYRLADAFR